MAWRSNGRAYKPPDAGRGAEAAAIDTAAAHLHQRLNGATVTPAIRTPLERS
jgi:hypothetical protein